MREDWELIEASFASQYGIRIKKNKDMQWEEFTTLLSGLLPETPLGQVVSIRSETDKKIIKGYNSSQKKIYRDWQTKKAKAKERNTEELEKEMNALAKALEKAFGNS